MSDLQLDIDFLINNPAIRDAVRKARLDIAGLADGAQKNVDQMDRAFKKLSYTVAGVFSANQAKEFVMELINVRGEFQQLEIAFTTILQSKEKANALMAEVVDLAAKTPFSLRDAASGAKQLLAYGTASEVVVDTLRMLGNVASGVSAPLNDIVYLYGTLQASGRVTQMDINQFAGRGIPIYQALADVMGKNTKEIKDLVSAGKVGFPEIQAAFERMTGAGGQFYNLMEAQSKSLTGQISNLGDAWDQMLNDIGKANEGVLSDGIALIASMVENYQTIIDILKVLIVTYGVYRAALIANTLATSGMTAVELLHYGALVLAEKAQKLLNMTTLANPYVAAATALAALVTALIVFSDKMDVAAKSQENINSIRETATKLTIEHKQKLEDLVKTANNETLTLKEREAALRKINQTSPEFLGHLTLAKLRTEEGRKAIEEYNRSIDLMALKQASFDKRVEIQKQKAELLSGNAEEKIGWWDRAKANFRTGKSGDFNKSEYEKVRKQQAADFDKQLADIDAYESNEIAKYNAKKPKEIKTEIKRTVSVIDEEIKAKKEAQENVSTKAEYTKLQKEINALEQEKAAITGKLNKVEQKQGNDRLDFLKKLAEKEAEIKRKGLSQNQSEVKKAQDEYAALRKEADKLKLGAGVKERLNTAEKSEVGFLEYDQRTEALEKELEKQKQLYTSFEDFKKLVGEEKAKERFKNQIDTEKTYLQYLENLNKEFDGKTSFNSVEDKRQQLFVQQIQEAKTAADQLADQQYAEAFTAAKTHAQRLLDIQIEYQNSVKSLGEKATAEQIAILQRIRNEKIQAEGAANFESVTSYRDTLLALDTLARGAALKELERLKTKLEAEKKANNISVAEYKQKLDEINGYIARINGTDGSIANPFKNSIDAVKRWRDTLKEVPADSKKAKDAFKDAAFSISDAANGAADIVGSVAKGFDSLGIGSEQLQKDMANVQGMLGGIGDLAKGIATGNPVDIVKGSINLLTNAFELFNFKDKKAEKRIKAYQQQLKDLGKAFDDLERGINNSIGESYYADSEKAVRNLRQQQTLLQKSINEERGKKKADAGKIDAWQSELDAIPGKIQDINNAVTEMLVQTSFKELANNLSDAFAEAFKVGEDAAGRFDDVFNKVIQNAVKNSLKLKFIEKPVSEFTEALATYMKGNGNSVAGFDFAKWKAILKSAGDSMTGALQGFEDFFKTDVDTKTDDKTVSAAIKGITADQADLLAGQFGGQRIATLEGNELQKQGNETAMQQLAQAKQNGLMLVKIEDNTRRSAEVEEDYLPYLKEIASKMNNNNNALRAAGG